ncbi:Abi family protein [Megasphaera coli]|uniref:Abi family protein n=1 Tax=Colibacter massiliensis TaxID=1852379 RepID=UPI00094E1145|nr:Abi family protein [Colibacter massiliensis]
MLTIRQMMRYLRNTHKISIKSSQVHALRNLGYYHGYKGYRFIRTPQNKIPFRTFDELLAINNFDMHLKSLLYSKVMFIETALKSYVIEAILADSKSENINDIFNHSLTYYKTFAAGSQEYKRFFTKRISLRGSINSTLKRDYNQRNQIVNHFFNKDREIPIWAIFESMTLGDFGTFFWCCNKDVKLYTSKLLGLPSNLDADGKLTKDIIFTIKDLRNAIAHNNVIFDARFRSNRISPRLINLLQRETSVQQIDFQYIDAYIILILYVLRKMQVTKTECKQLISRYNTSKELLRQQISVSVWNQILGSGTRQNMESLKVFLTKS